MAMALTLQFNHNQPRLCEYPEAFTPRVIRVRLVGTQMLEGVMEVLDRLAQVRSYQEVKVTSQLWYF